MSKADTLLKKATFFERLALYSDRKTFLQSLAQGGATDPDWTNMANRPFTDAQIKSGLERVSGALSSWVSQHGNRLVDAPGSPRMFPNSIQQAAANVMNAARYSEFNNQLLTQVYQALRQISAVATFRDIDDDAREAYTNTVFPASTASMDAVYKSIQAGGTKPVAPKDDDAGPMYPGMGLVPMEGHAVPEKEKPGAKPAGPPPINRADQAAVARLFRDMVNKGQAAPVADTTKMNDGVLGPETRKALEAIKDYYKKTYPQNARMTDQEAINAAKSPASQVG